MESQQTNFSYDIFCVTKKSENIITIDNDNTKKMIATLSKKYKQNEKNTNIIITYYNLLLMIGENKDQIVLRKDLIKQYIFEQKYLIQQNKYEIEDRLKFPLINTNHDKVTRTVNKYYDHTNKINISIVEEISDENNGKENNGKENSITNYITIESEKAIPNINQIIKTMH